MPSKTPQFDKALDEYFSKLEFDDRGGQWRTCRISGNKFYVRPEDIEFYKRIRVPLPTLSPNERHRLRMSFMNSYNLFRVKSAFSGKQIITMYPPNTPYKIIEHRTWYSDAWDPMTYAKEYDEGRPFFEQLHELSLVVPRYNLYVDPRDVNSEYTNHSVGLKNCYLVFNSVNAENCLYGLYVDSINSVECLDLFNGNTCHECFESHELYHCFWCEFVRNCQNSYFLYDCRGCSYCFCSTNLRYKKYYFLNEPLSKETYEARMREINFGDRTIVAYYKEKFEELKKQAVYKPNHNEKSVSSVGDYLMHSRDCYACFFVTEVEKSAYILGGLKFRDCYDLFAGFTDELSYEMVDSDDTYNVKFADSVGESRSLEYCLYCDNCENCFGCDALRNKKFCIFNRQYSEDEYWRLIDKVKTDMLKSHEYGEFFPYYMSAFPYNITHNTSWVGYDNIEEAKKYGYRVEDILESPEETSGEMLETDQLPIDIKDVGEDILNKVIFDRKNNKKFRFIKAELDFYRKYNIPLPQEHPSIRLAKQRKKFGSIKIEFYARTCPKCAKKFETVYSPEDLRVVWCEPCYLKEVV